MGLPQHYRRLFSANFRKNLKLPLGGMPFSCDFVNADRGDPCPLCRTTGEVSETTGNGLYTVAGEGEVSRLIGAYAPYATYDMTVEILPEDSAVGFTARMGEKTASVLLVRDETGKISACMENGESRRNVFLEWAPTGKFRFLVTCRGEKFDCYIDKGNGYAETVCTFAADGWEDLTRRDGIEKTMMLCTVRTKGTVRLFDVSVYMDSGLRQADIRPIRYEDGSLILEQGKICLTMSIRMEEGWYQGVFSWVPGTMDFALVGALFFDSGDGLLANDVASSIVFDRNANKWYLWVAAFTHGHRLAHAACKGDPRFGVNVIDYTVMEPLREGEDGTVFRGKAGDEDPDFIYDRNTGKWYLTICRHVDTPDGVRYRYHLFETEEKTPFDGFRFVTRSESGNETGGSLHLRDDGMYFSCGSDFELRSRYHIFRLPDMKRYEIPTFDYCDGGFRGWGTILPITRGTRENFYFLTFDRERGSDYTWSYGNLYCFIGE